MFSFLSVRFYVPASYDFIQIGKEIQKAFSSVSLRDKLTKRKHGADHKGSRHDVRQISCPAKASDHDKQLYIARAQCADLKQGI